MSGCIDRRFEKMLYAFELGLLKEDELREMEIHLIECNSCFEKARQFENASNLLKFDPDVRESVMLQQLEEVSETKSEKGIWGQFLKNRFALAVAAIFVAILLFQPWNIGFKPIKEAFAAHNRLTIMYFDNMVDTEDSDRLGDVLTNLLITDMSQASDFQVISQQRISDLLKNMGHAGKQKIDEDLAEKLVKSLNADWVVTGAVLQTEPNLVVTSHITEVRTGKIIASERISAGEGETVFGVVDRLSMKLKRALDPSADFNEESDPKVARLTTASPEAYRSYLAGLELADGLFLDKAILKFMEAVRLDTTFALAYYQLAKLGPSIDKISNITKAEKYSIDLGEKQRRLIKAQKYELFGENIKSFEQYSFLVEKYPEDKNIQFEMAFKEFQFGMYELSKIRLEKVVNLDPSFKQAYNILAYTNAELGRRDEVFRNLDKYIELAPDEPNPYDSRGELYLRFGEVDSAEASFKLALEKNSDFYPAIHALSRIYLTQGKYDEAYSMMKKLDKSAIMEYKNISILADAIIATYRGKFGEALGILDDLIANGINYRTVQPTRTFMYLPHFMKAKILMELGNYTAAEKEQLTAQKYINRFLYPKSEKYLYFNTHILATSGAFDKAENELESFGGLFVKADSILPELTYPYGVIDFYKGKYREAADLLLRSVSGDKDFYSRFMLGRTYLKLGQFDDAVNELESLRWIKTDWDHTISVWDVKMYYYLGIAYEGSGKTDQAISAYEKFLSIWSRADNGIEEIVDARRRLQGLKSKL